MLAHVLMGIMTAAAIAAGTPNVTSPELKTYCTPYGGNVYVISTDATTHDDDVIIGCDEAAEIYITFECESDFYTLYSMESDGIHEIWMTGRHTVTVADDFCCDYQVWDYPTVNNTYQN